MTDHAMKKGIIISHVFKKFKLSVPSEILFEILDHLHHKCANIIIRQWYRFIEQKELLVKRVLEWCNKFDNDIIIPFDFTHKLVKDCIKKITFFTDDHDWWQHHFKKMFKTLAPLENILYCENNNFVTSEQLINRIGSIEESLKNYNNNVYYFMESPWSRPHREDEENMYIDWFLIKNRFTFASDYRAFYYRHMKFNMNSIIRSQVQNHYSSTWLQLFDKYNCPPEWIKYWLAAETSHRRDQILSEISPNFNHDHTLQNWLVNAN